MIPDAYDRLISIGQNELIVNDLVGILRLLRALKAMVEQQGLGRLEITAHAYAADSLTRELCDLGDNLKRVVSDGLLETTGGNPRFMGGTYIYWSREEDGKLVHLLQTAMSEAKMKDKLTELEIACLVFV